MKLSELNFKLNSIFLLGLFVSLAFELILESLGANGSYLPNFIMCIVFSFAFLRPVTFWLVGAAVIVSESFFSSTPGLMTCLILVTYLFVTKTLPRGGLKYRNFHIVVFMLIGMVVYSFKILWLYSLDLRLEVGLMVIKMLVTIILFPLFYLGIEKLLKLLMC